METRVTLPRALVAVGTLLALCIRPSVRAAPVGVTDYPGLVDTVGSDDVFETGERFNR